MPATTENHWDRVYAGRLPEELSWFEETPDTSLRLVRAVLGEHGSVVDVGAGASRLVDELVAGGATDVTVVDVSAPALAVVQRRLGDAARQVTLVHADVLGWAPARTFDVWHDRAVFHFLTDAASRARYVRTVETALPVGAAAVVATFAPDGPTRCSGLDVCRYDAEALAATFGAGFVLEQAERVNHTTPAGVVQPFTWVVLRRR